MTTTPMPIQSTSKRFRGKSQKTGALHGARRRHSSRATVILHMRQHVRLLVRLLLAWQLWAVSLPTTQAFGRQHRPWSRTVCLSSPVTRQPPDGKRAAAALDMQPRQQAQPPLRDRAALTGVSVSPTGFWVVLQLGHDRFWPVQVTGTTSNSIHGDNTTPPNDDVTSATSAEALTLLQLMASVDMAGMVLPPEALSRTVVWAVEQQMEEEDDTNDEVDTANDDDSDDDTPAHGTPAAAVRQSIRASVQQSIQRVRASVAKPKDTNNENSDDDDNSSLPKYGDQNDWIQSRVRLPTATLDEVQMTVVVPTANNDDDDDDNDIEIPAEQSPRSVLNIALVCTVSNHGPLTIPLTPAILQEVCYNYLPDLSASFFAIALSLRYQAPIVVEGVRSTNTHSDNHHNTVSMDEPTLVTRFPHYRGTTEVLQPSSQSQATIERGFEIHTLQAALQLARTKGDDVAAAKIRHKIDELDAASFRTVPVQPDSETDRMQ